MSESRSRSARPRKIVIALSIWLLGAFIGWSLGYRHAWKQGEDRLVQEVVGALAREVEVLSRIRTGDRGGALEILESSMDQGVLTIAAARPQALVQSRPTFGAVKLYRSAHPSTSEIAAALEPVETLDLGFCSPALQQIAAEARGRAGR